MCHQVGHLLVFDQVIGTTTKHLGSNPSSWGSDAPKSHVLAENKVTFQVVAMLPSIEKFAIVCFTVLTMSEGRGEIEYVWLLFKIPGNICPLNKLI